jgi:hypothetical protein
MEGENGICKNSKPLQCRVAYALIVFLLSLSKPLPPRAEGGIRELKDVALRLHRIGNTAHKYLLSGAKIRPILHADLPITQKWEPDDDLRDTLRVSNTMRGNNSPEKPTRFDLGKNLSCHEVFPN